MHTDAFPICLCIGKKVNNCPHFLNLVVLEINSKVSCMPGKHSFSYVPYSTLLCIFKLDKSIISQGKIVT